MWVIDEYAIIDLSFLWFMPKTPPVIALIQAIKVIMDGAHEVFRINVRIVRGPSFCHVLKIRQLIHEIEDITEGNQKWHGAIPIFKIMALMIMYDGTIEFVWNHREVEAIRIRLDPKAWIKKYLVAASVSWNLFEEHKIGINLRRLISSPHHRRSQFDLDTIIIVLVIREKEVRISKGEYVGDIGRI